MLETSNVIDQSLFLSLLTNQYIDIKKLVEVYPYCLYWVSGWSLLWIR